MDGIIKKVFHAVCVKNPKSDESLEDKFKSGLNEAEEFFNLGFDSKIDFAGKTVIDIGCGLGSTCIYMALNGAQKVVGIDINRDAINFAKLKLSNEYQNLTDIVDFQHANVIEDEKFDIVLSKNSFEHYDDPENIIITMKGYLKRDGMMVIGFEPLWKSPHGGHISYMTNFPWAHLIFPESIIMAEHRKYRPKDNAQSFEQVAGGLNKMTFSRYLKIIKENNLEIVYLKTNVNVYNSIKFPLLKVLSLIPFCRDFFTANLYSILRFPSGTLDD